MKRNWLVAMTAIAALAIAGAAFGATIVGSNHDLTTYGTSNVGQTADGQVCIYCHTPHNANQTVAPLWNRNATTATFTMYNSPTMDMTVAGSPQGISLACLGCHDGTIALDEIVNGTIVSPTGNAMTGDHMLGTDLSNDHPISVTYDPTKDPEFDTAANVKSAGLELFGTGADQVECGSCHDVHDPAIDPFLRISNAASALCLTCHVK